MSHLPMSVNLPRLLPAAKADDVHALNNLGWVYGPVEVIPL
jgi:hypothetical protein